MENFTQTVLAAIGSTEETTFGDFCSALGTDMPSYKAAWRELFILLEDLEKDGYVEIERTNGKIESLILTESGAAIVREALDKKRPLFHEYDGE